MDYQLLRAYDNYISASITLARLDEEGIRCYLKDEYTVTIDPILNNAVGGIKLMVLQEDFDQAKNLLDGFDEQYHYAATCPQCGSHNITLIKKPGLKNWLTALLSWAFTNYAVAPVEVYHCFDCGYEAPDLPEANADDRSIL